MAALPYIESGGALARGRPGENWNYIGRLIALHPLLIVDRGL
jgi:hypothetical protein